MAIYLNKKKYIIRYIFNLLTILLVLSIMLMFVASYSNQLGIILAIILVIAFIIIIVYKDEYIRYFVGDVGEKRVTKELSELDDKWYIYDNFKKIKNNQIDHILIGPKGIFTIETKNFVGTIFGNEFKDNWKQVKNRKYNGKKIKNPIKQANRHSLVLNNELKKIGIDNIWVYSIVVFASRNVELKVYSPKTPVIDTSKLLDKINSYNDNISEGTINKIVNYIK